MGAPSHSDYLSTGALIHLGQQPQYGCTRSLRLPQYWCIDSPKAQQSQYGCTRSILVHWFTQANNLHMGTPGHLGHPSTGRLIHDKVNQPTCTCVKVFRMNPEFRTQNAELLKEIIIASLIKSVFRLSECNQSF